MQVPCLSAVLQVWFPHPGTFTEDSGRGVCSPSDSKVKLRHGR